MKAAPHHHARTIEVTVSPAGEIRIEAQGFRGAGCEAATAYLEEALGTAAERTRKPEFRASAKASARSGRRQQIGRKGGGA